MSVICSRLSRKMTQKRPKGEKKNSRGVNNCELRDQNIRLTLAPQLGMLHDTTTGTEYDYVTYSGCSSHKPRTETFPPVDRKTVGMPRIMKPASGANSRGILTNGANRSPR